MPSRSPPSPRRQRLAELIAEARETAELRQSEVAERLGRHQPFVSEIENGQRRLDLIEFLDIAEAIGVDPHALVEELRKTPRE